MTAAPAKPRPAWDVVRMVALQDDHLPRVLAGFGFLARIGILKRGEVAWWPPEYRRVIPWHRRECWDGGSSLAARGLIAGRWDEAAAAQQDRWQAVQRDNAAVMNREMRDSAVLIMLAPKDRPFRLILIDTGHGQGCWRDPANAVRGDCVISLGMLMWREDSFGRAAARIARLCGLRRIPDLPPPSDRLIPAAA